MRESIYLILSLLLSQSLFAEVDIYIKSPCSNKILSYESYDDLVAKDVGELTIYHFEKNNIFYKGSKSGISSINDTPTGLESVELISDTQMNTYGWCYSVNGKSPEKFPSEVKLNSGDKVIWWYGFAHYDSGKWLTQCAPSVERKDSEFCKQF